MILRTAAFVFICCSITQKNVAGDNLEKIISNFYEDCIEGELLETDGDLELRLPVGSTKEREHYIILNGPLKDYQFLTRKVVENEKNEHPVSYITRLANFNKIDIKYDVVKQEGPSHKSTFHMQLTLGDEVYEESDKSKKECRKILALKAMEKTEYKTPVGKIKKNYDLTPTAALNNLIQKLGVKVEYYAKNGNEYKLEESSHYNVEIGNNMNYLQQLNKSLFYDVNNVPIEDDSNNHGPFMSIVSVGDRLFKGYGYTKQGARHDAAANALKTFKEEYTDNEEICNALDCDPDLIKSPTSLLFEVAHKIGTNAEFDLIDESGPAHKRHFKMRCTFDKYTTYGEGKSKKEAKRNAAYNMLHQLRFVTDLRASKTIDKVLMKKKKKKIGIVDDLKKLFSNAQDAFSSMVQTMYTNLETNFMTKNEQGDDVGGKFDANDDYKNTLVNMGIVTKYRNAPKSDGSYASFLSLNTKPPFICLGQASTSTEAERLSYFYTLKFIKKLKILPKNTDTLPVEETTEIVIDYGNMVDIAETSNQ